MVVDGRDDYLSSLLPSPPIVRMPDRAFDKAYMLWGGESKAVSEVLSDHGEKKYLRNLLTALQEVEGDKRKQGGKGHQGKGGQARQVCVVGFVFLFVFFVVLVRAEHLGCWDATVATEQR